MTDSAAEALAELAVASLPFRPQPDLGRRFLGSVRLPELDVPRDHAAVAEFEAATKEDELFRPVWEAGHDGLWVSASDGSGWRIQAVALASTVLDSASQRVLFSAGDPNDGANLRREVLRSVDDLRVVLAGGQLDTMAFTAFNGIALPGGGTLATPWGELRNAGPVEAEVNPFADAMPTAIVETPTRVSYKVGEPDPDSPSQYDQELGRGLAQLTLLLPLALMLGVERQDHYVVCDWLWQTTLIPLQHGLQMSGNRPGSAGWRARFMSPALLNEDELDGLREWMGRVEAGFHSSISVAVRRTLSSVRERVDPEDSLIDAVVACENLFGHGGETEVTFRVTSAISVLLEPNAAARAAYRSRMGKVYKARSQVVHGGDVDPAKLNEHKELAIATATKCLRCLFVDHPHLLRDRDRGMRLILRADAARDDVPSDA